MNLADATAVTVRRRNRRYELPEEGIVYPAVITLPDVSAPRNAIINFGEALGLTMPSSYSRPRLLDRISDTLLELDYERDGQTLTRAEPIHVQYIDAVQAAPEIELPATVPYSVFDTLYSLREFVEEHNLQEFIPIRQGRLKRDLVRDLRGFLAEHGYAIDAQGNFNRMGGVTIQGGYELPELITQEQYLNLIASSQMITVTQDDLIKLNLPLTQLITSFQRNRWPTLQDFAKDAGTELQVDSNLMMLVALLSHLPQENNYTLKNILLQLGDTHNYSNMNARRQAVRNYLRLKLSLIPRSYEQRTEFAGNATTKMTLMEAIEGGYRFDAEQYQDDIEELINYEHLSRKQTEYLVQFIQEYPEMITEMRKYYSSGSTFTSALIDLYYTQTPSILQQLYAFAVNYPLVFEETSEERQRRTQIETLPQSYRDTLYAIYSTRNIEDILEEKQDPLELYLYAIAQLKVDQLPGLVQQFGMMVPGHLLTREIRNYVLRWMPKYKHILVRDSGIPGISEKLTQTPHSVRDLIDELKQYTDMEIINFFGYVAGFENRNALINNIYDLITDEGFIIVKDVDTRRAVNAETVMLTEVQDLISPYLVFGSPLSYRVHELDEFIQAWRDGTFRKVIGDGNYRVAQVSKLQTLLPLMGNINGQLSASVKELLTIVKSNILRTLRRNQDIDAFIRSTRDAPEQMQTLIKDIFYQLFYTGMYMRKWRGPGHSYPTQAVMTQRGNNPDQVAVLALGKLSDMLSQLQEADTDVYEQLIELPKIEYNAEADDMSIRNGRVFRLVNRVSEGDYCIRQASKTLVIAGHYYLGVIFGEVIPDFSPYDVEAVS